MEVTVNFWAQLKKAAGRESENVQLDSPCSVHDLVKKMAAEHGEPLQGFLLDEDGDPRRNLLIIIDNCHIPWEESVELKDGDVLTIMPPISGGRFAPRE